MQKAIRAELANFFGEVFRKEEGKLKEMSETELTVSLAEACVKEISSINKLFKTDLEPDAKVLFNMGLAPTVNSE